MGKTPKNLILHDYLTLIRRGDSAPGRKTLLAIHIGEKPNTLRSPHTTKERLVYLGEKPFTPLTSTNKQSELPVLLLQKLQIVIRQSRIQRFCIA